MGNCKSQEAPAPTVASKGPAKRASAGQVGDHTGNRRLQIFEPAQNQEEVDLSALLKNNKMDIETKTLMQTALSRFFGDESAKTKMQLVIGAMEKENIAEDRVIIAEGEPGDKLYVIEKGELEVTINGKVVRTMVRGDMVGELALLYDSPRSATVRTITETVVWSLSREHFKSVQAVSTSAVHLQRAKWLINSTDLAILSQIELSRLIGVLQRRKYASGDKILTEGVASDEVVLIESGKTLIGSTHELAGLSLQDRDKLLGITRPKHLRKSMQDLDAEKFAEEFKNLNTSEESLDPADVMVETSDGSYEAYHGCLIGMSGLRAKAGLESGAWKWTHGSEGAVPPLTVTAEGPVVALIFNWKVFDTLFGPDRLSRSETKRQSLEGDKNLRKFDSSKFKMKHVLGSGSFGVVIFAESREDPTGKTHYALKVLSKVDVIVTGQLRHVMDERRLLALMESPFILKLYGTYQTPHQIVMVTETINNGDMWSVLYEPPFYNKSGLPPKLILFYTASIVMALSHIHGKGIAYRDLKPENIMIDSKGYIRLIDFGFCKTIPYAKVDEATGESKVYAKSYTLCGTPGTYLYNGVYYIMLTFLPTEYLAPEFVFNLGHDHSADLWALGVMIYEMYMTVTPFAPKRVDNITELFNNIAVTKTNGVRLPAKLEERAKSTVAGDLILHLLCPEPAQRMGVQEGYTSVILEHEFFRDLDVEGLVNGSLKPVHIPAPPQGNAPISSLPAIKAFKGDQAQFSFF